MHEIESYENCDIHWAAEARTLLMSESGCVRGIKARKADGLLHDL
jgi:tricarballylate dehydrogenase